MNIIAVDGLPKTVSIKQAVNIISKILHVKFQGLNFGQGTITKGCKVFYINILDNVDLKECMEKVNGRLWGKCRLKAFIPDKIPDIDVSKKFKKMQAHCSSTERNRLLKIPPIPVPKEKMIIKTRNDILYELQDRYTGLADIDETKGHKLIYELSKTLEERLQNLFEVPESMLPPSCFVLSKNYRMKHTHETDFELIKSCLQRAGGNGAELTIEMLKPFPPPYESCMIDNLPIKKVQEACNKYSSVIIAQIINHINSLETDGSNQMIDMAARYKVREQMKKLVPYVPAIVNECLAKHFVPVKDTTLLRVYGVPCLPKLDVMVGFIKKYQGSQFQSPHLYNCLQVQVPNSQVPAILAADDTIIDGRRLVVRTFTRDIYRKILKEITWVAHGRNIDSMDAEELDVQMENEEAWENWEEEPQ